MNRNLVNERISLVKVGSGEIQSYIKNGINLIGGLKLSSDSSIIIKPNLCCIKSPETGATTDVKVVEGIVCYLKNEFGISDISIVESDATQVLADMAFKLLGYEKLSKKYNLKLVNLTTCKSSPKEYPHHAYLKKIQVPEIFEKPHFFITVPKIKTHIDCMFTGALKNQYGCNPVQRKSKYHKHVDDTIVDLNKVFTPDLTIVDGLVALEGFRGPTDGIPIKLNALIFGRDPVAVDFLVSRIMGFNPKKINHLIRAEKSGLGKSNYQTVGLDPLEIGQKFNFFKPKLSNFYGFFCEM